MEFDATNSDFAAIAPPPSFQVVADVLRRRIALGVYFPGNPLPSERQLAEALGVGRSTIRAAIRILSDEGLVVTRRGRWGGTVVTEGGRGLREIASRPSDFRRDVREVFEFRLLVEPAAAAMGAERATDSELAQLIALAGLRPDTVAGYRAQDSRFHLAIAAMAGNQLVLNALEAARTEFFVWADAFFDTQWEPHLEVARTSHEQHEAIARAISARAASEAQELMRTHLLGAHEVFDRIVSEGRFLPQGERRGRAGVAQNAG